MASPTLQRVIDEVAEQRGITNSVTAFIRLLRQQLAEAIAGNDMAAVAAALDDLDAQQAELAAAIATNPEP